MADVFTKAKRSEVMARIRSRGNRDTERALARLLRAHGITGWRGQMEVRGEKFESRRKPCSGGAADRRHSRSSDTCLRRSAEAPLRSRVFRVRPDFVFPRQRVAVFVDGCFWHGCPKHSNPKKWLRKSSMPIKPTSAAPTRTGRAFWQAKLATNQARDPKVNRALRRAGWRVVRIWEHELKNSEAQSGKGEVNKLVRRIQRVLESSQCLALRGWPESPDR